MIEFRSVKYRLGNRFFDYNFKTNCSITGIYGLSGAGKTTLLNLLSGLSTPESGEILLNGAPLYNSTKRINIEAKKRKIGYVFQDSLLFPHLSVKDNLLYSASYLKRNTKIQKFLYNEVIELLDLTSLLKQMPRKLSGGERQRVAIGRALLSQPELILLDEPFSNVDCAKRKQVISYLHKVNHHFRVPMMIVSHHLEDIFKLTQQIILIENGKVTANDYVFNLIKNSEKPDLIRPKKYQNTIYAYLAGFKGENQSYELVTSSLSRLVITDRSGFLSPETNKGTKIQLCIKPDDIALSLEYSDELSMSNQLKGLITQIIENHNGIYCVVNCGFELLVEISQPIRKKLNLNTGQTVYCLINTKYLDVVHVFEKDIKIIEEKPFKHKSNLFKINKAL